MGIQYDKKIAKLTGFIGVEEAESLLEWLQSNPKGKIDLSRCEHLNAANLQVLMAAAPQISAWPTDVVLARWLRQALQA